MSAQTEELLEAPQTESLTGNAALKALVHRPDIVSLLMEAVRRSNGRHTFETLSGAILNRNARIWIKGEAVIVTEMARYPTGVMWLSAIDGAGDIETLESMVPDLEVYAQSIGCAGVEALGRSGFARVGRRHGYTETHRFIEKAF